MAPARLLARLRKAVSKVRFLLSFNLRQWLLSSTAASASNRRLGINNQTLSSGLLDIGDEYSDYFTVTGTSSSPTKPLSSQSKGGGSESPPLLRTISRVVSGLSAGSSDDINQRAEDFIEKFYRQLRMERQVSLELRYCIEKRDGFLEKSKSSFEDY